MPRTNRVPLTDDLVVVSKGSAAPTPEPGRRVEPSPEKRVSMTFRITEGTYEWLRRKAFDTRVSQQALVDKALGLLQAQDNGG